MKTIITIFFSQVLVLSVILSTIGVPARKHQCSSSGDHSVSFYNAFFDSKNSCCCEETQKENIPLTEKIIYETQCCNVDDYYAISQFPLIVNNHNLFTASFSQDFLPVISLIKQVCSIDLHSKYYFSDYPPPFIYRGVFFLIATSTLKIPDPFLFIS